MRPTSFIVAVLLLSRVSLSQPIHVPADYPTIQGAIDVAAAGDTVLVAAGVYFENVKVTGKSITLASLFIVDGDTSHISATVIDGSQPEFPDSASVVRFSGGESSGSLLSGFTISGGGGTVVDDQGVNIRLGGGVFCDGSSPRIIHNRIIGNRLTGPELQIEGAGIAGVARVSVDPEFSLVLDENLIQGNEIHAAGTAIGGGVSLWMSAVVRRNVISENELRSDSSHAVGGGVSVLSPPGFDLAVTLEGNQVNSNKAQTLSPDYAAVGGGLAVQNLRAAIHDNVISDNLISTVTAGAGAGIMLAAMQMDGGTLTGNTIERNTYDAGYGEGGGLAVFRVKDLLVDANRVVGNQAAVGGGILVSQAHATIRRNVVALNTSQEEGGGLWLDNTFVQASTEPGRWSIDRMNKHVHDLRAAPRPSVDQEAVSKMGAQRIVLLNNTIADNRSNGSLGGGAVYAVDASPSIENSIIWGNKTIVNSQIRGAVSATFNIVEGGFPGHRNLDVDPEFLDDLSYRIAQSSPAIDAGNPESRYDDTEDPTRPGMALMPAFGTVRNDLGATGGPAAPTDNPRFLGPKFAAFAERVESVPHPEKQGVVDSFLVTIGSTPFIEDNNVVYFLYQGNANQATVPGDANLWAPEAFPMTQLPGTVLWYREAVFEEDARLDYKIAINGTNWLIDPRNPQTILGGFGPNSELTMPGFEYPDEIDAVPGVPQGAFEKTTFHSDILNNSRVIEVYTPAGYDPAATDTFPLIYFHDGTDYTRLARAANILDNLIHQERIAPLIAIFVPPQGDRVEEYVFSRAGLHERFVVEEVMPFIDAEFRTMKRPEMRAMSGPSAGGLITTQICYNHPDEFGKCAPVSPSYWANDRAVFNMVVEGPLVPVHWYIDWGSYEPSIAPLASALVVSLQEKGAGKGAGVTWNEWHDGHSWGNWRAHMKEFLTLFFPGRRATGLDEEEIPSEFALLPNYPNPFNPETTIGFTVPVATRVSLRIFDVTGRQVAQLADRDFVPGRHELHWNSTGLASGVYVYRLDAARYSDARTLVVVK